MTRKHWRDDKNEDDLSKALPQCAGCNAVKPCSLVCTICEGAKLRRQVCSVRCAITHERDGRHRRERQRQGHTT